MLFDTVKLGERLPITVTAQDLDGNQLIDSSWSALCRISNHDGTPLLDVPMTIVGQAAAANPDTGEAPWASGRYWYDVRLIDPLGEEHVSDIVLLTVKRTSTPSPA